MGARRGDPETYIKRIKSLEEISESFDGVQQSFTIHAGHEVRVTVRPEEIDALTSTRAARDIAKKIEEIMNIPCRSRRGDLRDPIGGYGK